MKHSDPFVSTLATWVEVFFQRSMRGFLFYLKENNLSMSQVGALFHIHRGASGVTDLGDDLGVTSAAASQMLDRLVQQGLIMRSEDLTDRRVKHLVLTDKGSHMLQGVVEARASWLEELSTVLTPAEKEQVMVGLNILIEKSRLLENVTAPERS